MKNLIRYNGYSCIIHQKRFKSKDRVLKSNVNLASKLNQSRTWNCPKYHQRDTKYIKPLIDENIAKKLIQHYRWKLPASPWPFELPLPEDIELLWVPYYVFDISYKSSYQVTLGYRKPRQCPPGWIVNYSDDLSSMKDHSLNEYKHNYNLCEYSLLGGNQLLQSRQYQLFIPALHEQAQGQANFKWFITGSHSHYDQEYWSLHKFLRVLSEFTNFKTLRVSRLFGLGRNNEQNIDLSDSQNSDSYPLGRRALFGKIECETYDALSFPNKPTLRSDQHLQATRLPSNAIAMSNEILMARELEYLDARTHDQYFNPDLVQLNHMDISHLNQNQVSLAFCPFYVSKTTRFPFNKAHEICTYVNAVNGSISGPFIPSIVNTSLLTVSLGLLAKSLDQLQPLSLEEGFDFNSVLPIFNVPEGFKNDLSYFPPELGLVALGTALTTYWAPFVRIIWSNIVQRRMSIANRAQIQPDESYMRNSKTLNYALASIEENSNPEIPKSNRQSNDFSKGKDSSNTNSSRTTRSFESTASSKIHLDEEQLKQWMRSKQKRKYLSSEQSTPGMGVESKESETHQDLHGYYATLGLDPKKFDKYSQKQIEKAWVNLVKLNHPDHAPASKKSAAAKKFRKLHKAYKVLTSAEKRKQYDNLCVSKV